MNRHPHKSIFILTAFFWATQLQSFDAFKIPERLMQKISSTNTYNGTPITSENILALMPTTPAPIEQSMQRWLREHKELAEIMSGQEFFEGENPICTRGPEARKAYYDQIQERIKAKKYKNLSKWNVVIDVDSLFVKASGFPNRQANIRTELNKGYSDPLTAEDFTLFSQKHGGKTFQTISRAATYLRAIEAKKIFNLDRVELPETFLIHIPEKSTEVADSTYVVVEKKVENSIADLQNHPLALDQTIMEQLTILIGYTGLWNHVGTDEGNILVVKDPKTETLKVCYHDLEQPNSNRKPSQFFNKDTKNYVANIHHGWNAYASEIIQPYAQKIKATSPDPDSVEKTVASLLKKKQALEKIISEHLPAT